MRNLGVLVHVIDAIIDNWDMSYGTHWCLGRFRMISKLGIMTELLLDLQVLKTSLNDSILVLTKCLLLFLSKLTLIVVIIDDMRLCRLSLRLQVLLRSWLLRLWQNLLRVEALHSQHEAWRRRFNLWRWIYNFNLNGLDLISSSRSTPLISLFNLLDNLKRTLHFIDLIQIPLPYILYLSLHVLFQANDIALYLGC